MNNDKRNILLTDDDFDYLFLTKNKLKKMGFNVITAQSRREAERILESMKPDLCIFDLMMEEDDSGMILSYHCKNKYPDVPIIIATGVRSETGYSFKKESHINSSWIKADLYLEKGIDPGKLEIEINKLLEKNNGKI